MLATVMFTDIVGSTERAAEMGDRAWRELLDSYYAVVRRELARSAAARSTRAGDGVLATFDGPRARFAAPARCASACARSGSRSAPGCTPASAS